MLIKRLAALLMLSLLAAPSFAKETMQWYSLGKGKDHGVSGIANFAENTFLVVHDRKKPFEPRLSLLTWKKDETPFLTPLEWCDNDNFPIDLEAISAIPNQPKQFLLLESKGKVTRIQFNENNACEVTARFELPTVTPETNMEGLMAHCFDKDCILMWGERGNDKTAAKISWAKFDIAENTLEQVTTALDFLAPYPAQNRRSVGDLAIDAKGQVWASATSDPGDNGPFTSALYHLGAFTKQNQQIVWHTEEKLFPITRYEQENVKIEGLVFTPTALIIGSEAENLGGKIAAKPLSDLIESSK